MEEDPNLFPKPRSTMGGFFIPHSFFISMRYTKGIYVFENGYDFSFGSEYGLFLFSLF